MVIVRSGVSPDEGAESVAKTLARYRVQTKPGVQVAQGSTARDTLGEHIIALWKKGSDGVEADLSAVIDRFRMQHKGPSGGKGKARSSKKAAAKKATPAPTPAKPAAKSEPAPARRPSPPPAQRAPRTSPVAGGPRKRGKSRSECPKCHSMGVVLARSYAGDEYFSCIYCGWQAYRPADDSDPTASLAVRLLGQTAGDK